MTLDVLRIAAQGCSVILGYRDKGTQQFASGERVAAFSGFERAAQMKLDRLNAATTILDLAALPGNGLEALKGDRQGQWSIRVNWIKEDSGRVCTSPEHCLSG
jgi:proteic killer suppression protein